MEDDLAHGKRQMIKSTWSKIRKTSHGHGHGHGSSAPGDSVDDFLAGGPAADHIAAQSTRPVPPPHIDVSIAQRWPDAAQLRPMVASGQLHPSPLPLKRSGRARRFGLVVRFSDAEPEVMGYGGEQTREPTIVISRAKKPVPRATYEREPDAVFLDMHPVRDQSPYLPVMPPARTQSTNTRNEVYSDLASAGIFAVRPSSRGEAAPIEQDPVSSRDSSRLGQAPSEDYQSPPATDDERHIEPGRRPTRKPVPPAHAAPPQSSSHDQTTDTDDMPTISHEDSQEKIHQQQQQMRLEEARAFSNAYRLSQAFPDSLSDSEEVASRSGSQRSKASHDSAFAHGTPDLKLDGGPLASNSIPASTPGQRQVRYDESPSRQPYLQLSAVPGASQTPPVTPPVSTAQPDRLAPRDYLDASGARARSNSTNTTVSKSALAVHDSPQQGDAPFTTSKSDTDLRGRAMAVRNAIPARKPVASPEVMKSPQPTPRDQQGFDIAGQSISVPPTATTISRPPEASWRSLVTEMPAPMREFLDRVTRMKGVFRLIAQKEQPSPFVTPEQWLRCAKWWFHKGKDHLQQGVGQNKDLLTQGHVDVAKASWILTEVLSAEAAQGDGFPSEGVSALEHHLVRLTGWLDKQGLMPPEDALIQGQDTTLWLAYPQFPPHIAHALSCTATAESSIDSIPLADTKHYFYTQTLFVTASLSTDLPGLDRPFPCTLTLVRHRLQYRASMIIASQSPLLHVLVGAEHAGPTWHDLSWRAKSSSLTVNLPRGLALHVAMPHDSYSALARVVERARAVDRSFVPAHAEAVVFSAQLARARLRGAPGFPAGEVRGAFVGVFEARGQQQQQGKEAGRVVLVTPTTRAELGAASLALGGGVGVVGGGGGLERTVALRAGGPAGQWAAELTFEAGGGGEEFARLVRGLLGAR